ncbi:NAD(P)/FAD-dependent oxidoreductase [Nocardia sp. NPDC048505]|uniref:flavin-containing monooxygenase n=1 Tax=unclassified Nocardia TaxID=2637762 RepID=UPI00340AB7C5
MQKGFDLQVAIVGAGFGGLGMGAALRRIGVEDFVIFEKGDDVGGVWRENTYPGCNCDVPAHLYSFSFAPYRSRKTRYPGQTEILEYLRRVAREEGLTPHLRFGTAITHATFRADLGRWELVTATGERGMADVVVFAVGQLHRPYLPELPGQAEFTGAAFHSARWDHGQDLRGRDVAVIGTGSSAAQLLPEIAPIVRSARVFQRTPHWVLPKPSTEFGAAGRWALRLPGAHRLYRRALRFGADTLLAPIMRRGWSARPAEWAARRYLRAQVADPVLRARLTPKYPIGSKRVLFESRYYATLQRENVDLVTAGIARITPDGIETADGVRHHADIIVYATGFRAPEFLVPVTVRGRDGVLLHEQWSTGARAFMGVAVPGYPNAFLIAGPNSFNPAGSNPDMKEHQIGYILECLRWRAQTGAATIELSDEAMVDYQQWLRRNLAKTVWPATGWSWYKHASGRVTSPWPASSRKFERMLRRHPAHDFILAEVRTDPVEVIRREPEPDRAVGAH